MTYLRVVQAALRDEFVLDSRRKVVTCLIDPEDLSQLHVPWYQREKGEENPRRRKLRDGVQTGGLPDLLLNYRGRDIEELTAGELMLTGTVSVIDGHQRMATTLELLANGSLGGNSRDLLQGWLGAKIFVNLTEEEEYQLFGPLNRDQWRLGPAVIIRNEMQRLDEFGPLLAFSQEGGNPIIGGRVQWQQQLRAHELFGAKTYLSVIMSLHGSYVPTDTALLISGVRDLIIAGSLGDEVIQANLTTFYEAVDHCYGLQSIPKRRSRGEYPHIKSMFLIGLGRFLGTYQEFWDGNRLQLNRQMLARLKSFRFSDPVKAATTSNRGAQLLGQYLLAHFMNPPGGNSRPIVLTDRRR